jgi:error-prone DNA polymerase
VILPEDIPELSELSSEERLSWDYQTHGSARLHPMTLSRRALSMLEVRTIETCKRLAQTVHETGRPDHDPIVTTAGISILRQRPPTAKGFMFLTLEDETGFIQCVVPPAAQERLDHVLTASALIVRGAVQIAGNWRGMVLHQAWILDRIFGGYEGFPGTYGGRDIWIKGPERENGMPVEPVPVRA